MANRQMAHIKGELLRWARQSINLGLSEAAEKIGVKPEHLTACENGQALLTIPQLRKAAHVYRRPLAAFFLSDPPKDFHVPHDYRRVPDRQPRSLSPELIAEIRSAQYRRNCALELAETPPETPARFLGSVGFPASIEDSARKARTLLQVALEVQKTWDTQYDALNGWKKAVENLGVLVFHFSGVDVREARAFSIGEQPFPVISVNGGDSPHGRIFSLMHEFVHLLLGHSGTCDFREYEGATSADQQVEVFCNYVAGEILVPRQDLEGQQVVRETVNPRAWDEDELQVLADLYHVSREVVLRRLLIIGKTTPAFYRQRRDELVEQGLSEYHKGGGFLALPRRVIRAIGQPFLRIVLDAYYRDAITTSDLVEYIGARPKHLPALKGLLSGPNVLTGGDR